MFCYEQEGIAYHLFNKKYDENKYNELRKKVFEILGDWLPHAINYREMKKQGWHKEYGLNNEYVKEYILDYTPPYLKQYHDAWSRLPDTKKNALFKLIKETEWLHAEALEVFKKVTGLSEDCYHKGSVNYCPNCGVKLR